MTTKQVNVMLCTLFFVFGVAIIQTTNANVTTTAEPTAEETTPEPTAEETTPEQTAEETTPEQTAEETTPEQTAEETTPEQTAEETTPEQTAEETTPEQTAEETTPEKTAEATPPDPPPFHQGPQYTINCLESGNVEVKGVSESTSLTIVDGEKTCVNNSRTFNETHGKIVINSSCLSSDNFTDIRSVTFTIHDSTFDGKSSITPHPVDGIKGGQNLHRITVNCKPLPKSGMNVYVVHGVGLATPEPNIPTEIQKVEMRLKSEKYDSFKDVIQLPDVSTVYIGDKFYMYLVYLGKDQYSVIPTDCKAFDGAYASEPSSSVRKLDLYTTRCISQNAKDYRVMQPFHFLKDNETRIVSAEMYGFMFNLDNEITFVCTVNICNGGTCKLPVNCTDWPSRRRRGAIQDKQYTITKRLRVQRQTVQNSTGFIKSSCFCIILLQLFTRMW